MYVPVYLIHLDGQRSNTRLVQESPTLSCHAHQSIGVISQWEFADYIPEAESRLPTHPARVDSSCVCSILQRVHLETMMLLLLLLVVVEVSRLCALQVHVLLTYLFRADFRSKSVLEHNGVVRCLTIVYFSNYFLTVNSSLTLT